MEKSISFDHKLIEKKWQKRWEYEELFSEANLQKSKKKYYNLWMFPYPSAEGLHAGHAFASTGSDVYGRYMRMNGNVVFQPIGYDSFGIHSENYAIKIGDTPQNMLARTTRHYEDQLRSLGHGYDWRRTVTTSDVSYYKWTQWLFSTMFKAGLVYRKRALVNWCPSCKTVLSDEQVMTPAQAGKEPKDSKGKIVEQKEGMMVCERCGTLVEKKNLKQWFFRITDYADKLLENLSKIDWPEKIKIAQTNWIGKKEGIEINYPVVSEIPNTPNLPNSSITVWTSRPDTNFGATFVVVSPEYAKEKLLKIVSKDHLTEVEKYIKTSLKKSKDDRIAEGRKKTGVFTGLYAINQLNDYKMPIWVADFVLSEVGTGAVVGVPGHDRRDFEFAKEYSLEIKRVVVGSDGDESQITSVEQVQEEEGTMVNSEFLNGMDIHKATEKIMGYLEEKKWGKKSTNYHIRDWLISRQRYWGAPIPMVYCQKCAKDGKSWFKNSTKRKKQSAKLIHPDQSDWNPAGWWPEENLPVELPEIKDYKPEGTGKGPLAAHAKFYEVTCPECGSEAIRETDVMDTFVDSSWYFLRYPSVGIQKSNIKNQNNKSKSKNKMENGKWKMEIPWNPEVTRRWLPVDLYFGGAEHAVLHLMYSRFVTMVMNDLNYIDFDEPFPRFFAHGLMIKDGAKMSKSRGNVVNPDEYIEKYGADTLRLYLMFMGPMEGYPDFRDTGIEGMRRFVDRLWKLFSEHKDLVVIEEKDAKKILIKMHQTIKKVTSDIKVFKYNTAIASIMEFVNLLQAISQKSYRAESRDLKSNRRIRCAEWDEALKTLALLLNPFTPHLAEEVWHTFLNQKTTIQTANWPTFEAALTLEKEVTIAVQVDGKLRATLRLALDQAENKEVVVQEARKVENISKWLKGKDTANEIFVPGRLLNIVTKA